MNYKMTGVDAKMADEPKIDWMAHINQLKKEQKARGWRTSEEGPEPERPANLTQEEEIWWDDMERHEDELLYKREQMMEEKKLLRLIKNAYFNKGVSFDHVLRVWKAVDERYIDDYTDNKIAILHDVIEDGVMTEEEVLAAAGPFGAKKAVQMAKGQRTNDEYYGQFADKVMLMEVKIIEVLDLLKYSYDEYADEIRRYFLPILEATPQMSQECEELKKALRREFDD